MTAAQTRRISFENSAIGSDRIAAERYLERHAKDPGSGIKRLLSLAAMVPQDYGEKAPILKQIERSLREALKADLKPEDRKRVEEGIRLATAKPSVANA